MTHDTEMADQARKEESEQGGEELSRRKRVLFWIVLLALLAIGLEVGAGYVLRFTQGYDGEHLMQYRFDPYKNVRNTPGFVDTRGVLRHNSQGFREDSAIRKEAPEDTYRIFLMGGSTAYGTGGLWTHIQSKHRVLSNHETIDHYLERILDQAVDRVDVQVVNAAIPSMWTHHHLIYLNQEILEYDPDMVLFLDGFNDFFFHDPDHDQFSDYAYRERSRVIMGPPTTYSLVYSIGWWLFRESTFFHALFRGGRQLKLMLQGKPEQTPMQVDQALRDFRSVFKKNALEMIERTALLLENEGVKGVFMLQPMLILEGDRDLTPVEREMFRFHIESYRPGSEEYMKRAVKTIRRLEPATVRDYGGKFIDLTDIYEGVSGQIFTDYCHLTPRGNRILAKTVASEIVPVIQDSTSGARASDRDITKRAAPPVNVTTRGRR